MSTERLSLRIQCTHADDRVSQAVCHTPLHLLHMRDPHPSSLRQLWLKHKKLRPTQGLFTLHNLTSVCIFSILFSIHFPRCRQREFVYQSRAFLFGDHFFYSCDLNVRFCSNTVKRIKMLITCRGKRGQWINKSLCFFSWNVNLLIPGVSTKTPSGREVLGMNTNINKGILFSLTPEIVRNKWQKLQRIDICKSGKRIFQGLYHGWSIPKIWIRIFQSLPFLRIGHFNGNGLSNTTGEFAHTTGQLANFGEFAVPTPSFATQVVAKDNCHRVDLWCHRVDLSVKWLGTAIINVPYHLFSLSFLNTLISHQMAGCWVFSAASASIHRRWHQPAVAIPPLFCGRKTAARSGHSNRIDQRNAWVRLHHRGWGPSRGTPTDQEHRPRRCRGKGWSAKNGWCSEKGQWHVCVDSKSSRCCQHVSSHAHRGECRVGGGAWLSFALWSGWPQCGDNWILHSGTRDLKWVRVTSAAVLWGEQSNVSPASTRTGVQ